MGDDEPDALVAPHERFQVLGDRRETTAAVDEDRHRALDREREDRREPLVVQGERLRAWMELDPLSAEVEAAPRLLEWAAREVEADERDEPALRALGVRERPVVR